jgi:hypothetical protein
MSYLSKIKTELLHTRFKNQLTSPTQVLAIVRKHQPPISGLDNDEWKEVCNFILGLERANDISVARKIAEENHLDIWY